MARDGAGSVRNAQYRIAEQCPFRAYAQLRLGGEPMDLAQPGIAADIRGILLHRALEALWERLQGSTALIALSKEDCNVLITACVDKAAASLWGAASETPAQAREQRRARRLIGVLCRLERERAPFNVVSRELRANLLLGGAMLRVQIDRLDALTDGSQVILDYKSGRRTQADWYGERPSHVQLLAYLAVIGDPVRAIATVNVTAREVRFDGLAASSGLLPKVPAVSRRMALMLPTPGQCAAASGWRAWSSSRASFWQGTPPWIQSLTRATTAISMRCAASLTLGGLCR